MADEIHRIVKNSNYVIMDRRIFHNKKLSWKAKGIMAYVLTLPNDWTFRLEEIITHSIDKRDSFRSGWKELQEQGYVERIPIKDDKGIIVRWETHVFECPEEQETIDPQTENPHMDNKSTNGFSASINGLSSHWENQTLDNPTLLSIEKELRIDSTKSTTTGDEEFYSEVGTVEAYKQVFGGLGMMPGLWSKYIRNLKKRGHADEVISEALLEAGESASGKPNLNFFTTIMERWIKDGIKSREESRAHRDKNKTSVQQKRAYSKPTKPELPVVQSTQPEQSGVSQELIDEAMRLAEQMMD
ncbi:DnaD domain protein [Paenibacillus nuruki]|uniref:DnaD domain protein n=1 Tax=Paenibacillus nuruki TaxID=1886670 RepID=UPI0028064B13|nr:DnaD domain protein [Paenibacillus nuruki]CAJ1315952.1 hypothetical protein AASFL403_12070 [Paenibacillus nuruki]